MIGGVAVPQLWFTLRLVVILEFVHRFRRSLFDQTGKFTGSLLLGDFVADLRRDRHTTLAISSTGSFSLMQLARFKRSICDHFSPVVMSAWFSRSLFI